MFWFNKNQQKLLFITKFTSSILSFLCLLSIGLPNKLMAFPSSETSNIQNKQGTKNNGVGRFILTYENSSVPELKEALQKQQIFDTIINDLNSSGLVMRQNIPVNFTDCGQPNAFWDGENEQIIMCYELINFAYTLFNQKSNYSQQEAITKSLNNAIFTFYHELGHALIDVLELSAVGQEEDTVDEFSAVMLFRKFDNDSAGEIILDSSAFYETLYQNGVRGTGWGEHAPNDKRLFNLVCFVYGSNPQKYETVFEEKFNLLAQGKASQRDIDSRAYKCRQQFPEKMNSWNKLLLPHFASQNQNQTPASRPSSGGNNTNPNGVSRKGEFW